MPGAVSDPDRASSTPLPVTALPDVNVLLALVWDQHVHHSAARRNFARIADRWATAPTTETGLVRLLLTPAVVGREVAGAEALGALRDLRAHPGWTWIADDASLADPQVDSIVLAGRRQVTDLHLVELAARHEAVLHTFDAGISSWLAPADRHLVHAWSA